ERPTRRMQASSSSRRFGSLMFHQISQPLVSFSRSPVLKLITSVGTYKGKKKTSTTKRSGLKPESSQQNPRKTCSIGSAYKSHPPHLKPGSSSTSALQMRSNCFFFKSIYLI